MKLIKKLNKRFLDIIINRLKYKINFFSVRYLKIELLLNNNINRNRIIIRLIL